MSTFLLYFMWKHRYHFLWHGLLCIFLLLAYWFFLLCFNVFQDVCMCSKLACFVSPGEGSALSEKDSGDKDTDVQKTCRSRQDEWEHDIGKVIHDSAKVSAGRMGARHWQGNSRQRQGLGRTNGSTTLAR